jgi:hypothetical protein
MKKILTTLLAVLPLLLLPFDACADKDKGKGPSDRAYERANDNASFKRDDDNKKHKKKDKKKGDHDDRDDRKKGDRDDHDRDDRKKGDRDDHDRDDRDRRTDGKNEKKGRFGL